MAAANLDGALPHSPRSDARTIQPTQGWMQLAASAVQPANNNNNARSAPPAPPMRAAPPPPPINRSMGPSPSFPSAPNNSGSAQRAGQPLFPSAPSVAQPTFSSGFQGVGGQTTQSTIGTVPSSNSNGRVTLSPAPSGVQSGASPSHQKPINPTNANQSRLPPQQFQGAYGPAPSNSFQGIGGQSTPAAVIGNIPPPTSGRVNLAPVTAAPQPALLPTNSSSQRTALPSATPNNFTNPPLSIGGQTTSPTVVGTVPQPTTNRVQLAPVSKQQAQQPGVGQLVVDTVGGLPKAASQVGSKIPGMQGLGEEITAVVGAGSYQKQLDKYQKADSDYLSTVNQRRSEARAAGRDTSYWDKLLREYKPISDSIPKTSDLYPGVNHTPGQVISNTATVLTYPLIGAGAVAKGAAVGTKVGAATTEAALLGRGIQETRATFGSIKEAEAVAATAGASKDYKALIEASKYAGGHAERHVAQTDFELAARLSREPKIQTAASTFKSQAEQEAALNKAFDVNSQKIQEWLGRGAKNDLKLDAPFSGGRVLQRGATELTDGSQVRAILRGNSSGGYYLLTAFPRP